MTGRDSLHKLWIWGPVVAYVAVIFYLSSLSQIPWFSHYHDYLAHFAEYLGLAILLARALNGGLLRIIPGRMLILAFVLCTIYAITDEVHQMFVPNRFSDYRDILSDAAGAASGLVVLHFGQRTLLRGDAA